MGGADAVPRGAGWAGGALRATHSYQLLFQTALQLGLGRAALAQLLRRLLFDVLPEAIEQVQAAIAHWPGFARAAGVDEAEARTIGQHMAQRAAVFVG